jgi:hypothetical protein
MYSVLKIESRKYLSYRDFLEKRNAENLQDFAQTTLNSQLLLQDGYQHVHTDRNPNLCLHGIDRRAIERFDPKILLDPFEEQFHLPATFVELRNGQGRQREVVRQKNQSLVHPDIEVTDSAKPSRIPLRCQRTGKDDGLVASQTGRFVHASRRSPTMSQFVPGANHKICCVGVEPAEPGEVDVSPVHDVERAGLQNQFVQDQVVGRFAACNADKTRDIPSQVDKRVEFDRALSLSELCPREQRQTQVDGRRIERIRRLLQVHAEVVSGIQSSGDANKNLREVGIDAPVSFFVCVGECASRYLGPDSCMIKFGLHGTETGFDISQALAVGQLCKCHAEKLIATGEVLDSVVALVLVDTGHESPHGHVLDDLREDNLSAVHRLLLVLKCSPMLVSN